MSEPVSEPVTSESDSPSSTPPFRVNTITPTPPTSVTRTEETQDDRVHLRVRTTMSNTADTHSAPATPTITPKPISLSPQEPVSTKDDPTSTKPLTSDDPISKQETTSDDTSKQETTSDDTSKPDSTTTTDEPKKSENNSKWAWYTEASSDAKFALAVLFGINLLNFIDRYVPSGAKSLIQNDLNLTDTQTSLPLTAFMVIYMTLSPVFAYLSEHGYPRTWLIALGVATWSVATSTTGLANNYAIFIVSRAFIGVGEAAYGTIAPALLSDYWSSGHRNNMLSFFYLAIPVGAAVGYGIGGFVGDAASWRVAFLVCGTPGVAMALLALKVVDPPRGCQESIPEIMLAMEQKTVTVKEALLELPRNIYYCYVVGGSTFVIFASGGMADWFPEWLHRAHNVSVGFAGLVVGGVTVLGGIGGILLGAYASEYCRSRVRNAYLFVISLALMCSSTVAFVVINLPDGTNVYIIAILILICQIFLWVYVGPVNSLLANCVPARLRVRAFGVSILVTHTFGDAISPSIIGALSDASGSLSRALILVPITFLLAGIIWGIGWYRLTPLVFEQKIYDEAQKQAAPTPMETSITPLEPPMDSSPVSPANGPRASLMLGIPDSAQSEKSSHHHLVPRGSIVGGIPVLMLEDTIVDGPDHGLNQPTNSPTVKKRHHSTEMVVLEK